ncbi:MAG: hypothetical protein AAFZ07_29960, partial [Actinomycetota bacterium]
PPGELELGVVELESTASQRGSYEIAIRPGRRVASIEEVDAVKRDGRRFRTYRLRRRYVATREGSVEFGRSVFKFSEVVGRSSGVFSRGKRRSFYAALEPFSIEVLPVPEDGRPLEWTGAVGRFEVSRDAARRGRVRLARRRPGCLPGCSLGHRHARRPCRRDRLGRRDRAVDRRADAETS